MWTGFGCIIFGCLLIHAWWFETYTDSALASAWRRMSAAWSPTRNAQAMLRPGVGLMFFFGGIALLLEPIGAPVFIVRVLLFIALLALVVGVVYLLPLPLPRFADPYYQYLKRHGLLDATGRPLPDEVINRILAERGGDTF